MATPNEIVTPSQHKAYQQAQWDEWIKSDAATIDQKLLSGIMDQNKVILATLNRIAFRIGWLLAITLILIVVGLLGSCGTLLKL